MKDSNIVNINLDTTDLDIAIEKVSQLKSLLLEVKDIIGSLSKII